MQAHLQTLSSFHGGKRGFALIVTLSLMILLTVIAVGLLTLSSISLRASGQSQSMATARANARLALMLALGEIQKEAGPDQRVTARAEILDSLPATAAVDAVTQPHWTGVWKTGDKPTEEQRSASIGSNRTQTAKWLVSNPTPAATTLPDPTTYSDTGENSVIMAKGLGTGPKKNDVIVPTVPIAKNSTGGSLPGKFAYWVSDEGVKAKVNLKDPTLAGSSSGGNYVKNLTHFATSQASAVHKVLPAPLNTDLRNSPAVEKVITLDTLHLVSGQPATVSTASFAPDVTAYSKGVLADVKNGGLRKDLTAAFEDTGSSGQYAALKASSGSGMDGQCVYRATARYQASPPKAATPFSPPGSAAMDGLRWRSLYLYYNLYRNSMPLDRAKGNNAPSPNGVQSSDLGISGGPYSIPMRTPFYKDEDGVGTKELLMDPIVPLVIQARVDIALESFVDPSSGKYRLRLRYHPMMVLWNPYSTRITSSLSPSISFYTNLLNINGRWNTTINVGSAAVSPFNVPYSLIQGNNYPLNLVSAPVETGSFEPGEIKVLALAKDVTKTTLGEPPATNVCYIQSLVSSNRNLSADWAQTYDLPWAGTSNPADIVSVNVANKNITANATYTNGGPFNAWPDWIGTWSGRFSSYNIPGATPANTWPSPPIGTMNGNPYLLVGFNYRAKGTKQTTDTNYYNSAFNPPMFMGNSSGFTNMDSSYGGYWRELYARCFKVYGTVNEVQLSGIGDGPRKTSWGNFSVGVEAVGTNNSRLVLSDIPIQPLFSLGQFMHLSSRYYVGSGAYGSQNFGSNFIGGSFASPNVALNENTNNSGSNILMDQSFMANQALFDSYFFSTVPAAGQTTGDNEKYVIKASELSAAIQSDQPLSNNRMRFHRKNGVPPTTADLRDLKKAAANLMVDGAFNVNSTSVNAWRALLSSLSGNDIRLWNNSTSSATTLDSTNLKNAIPRFWSFSKAGEVNQPWEGMRALTDDQVEELAKRIVSEVKTRGPFVSMGDFLNRRLAPSPTNKSQLYTMGALQAAIENTSPDINASIKSAGTAATVDSTFNGDPFGAHAFGKPATSGGGFPTWDTVLTSSNTSLPPSTTTGIPGYLMQQDLVQAFAPVMTARSDTFVIRAYGEATNPAGIPLAKAWCEAVIQRVPAFIDQSDPKLTAGGNNGDATAPADLNAINKTFARRFEIVSFRWLSSSEI